MYWLIFLLSFAYAKKQKTPCWITTECEPYFSEEYIIGVGSGDTVAQADNAAIGSISKQFVVQVQQRQVAEKDFSETMRMDREVSTLSHQSLRTQTSIDTTMELSGVQIAERFQDTKKDNNQHYALAIISRKDWLSRISTQRTALQEQINQHVFAIKKATHALDRMEHYEQIIPLIEQDELLLQQAKIIRPEETFFPSSSLSYIQAQQIQAQKSLYFVVDGSAHSRTAISQALSNSGFTVQSSVSDPFFAVIIQVEENIDLTPPNSYGFITAQADITLHFSASSRSLLHLPFRSSSSSQSKEKALSNLDASIQSDVQKHTPQITDMLRGK